MEAHPGKTIRFEFEQLQLNRFLFEASIALFIYNPRGFAGVGLIVVVCTEIVVVNNLENHLTSVTAEILVGEGKLGILDCLAAVITFQVFLYHALPVT